MGNLSEKSEKKIRLGRILPWVIIGVLLVATLVFVIVLNNQKTDDISGTTTEEIIEELDIDNGDQKIDWSLYPSYDVRLTESYKITNSGTYNLTGEVSDGMITIDANDRVVRLVLNGVTVRNFSGPALYIENAKDVVIELADGSKNTFYDSAVYSGYDTDVSGVIFSKDDLTFQGGGKLVVQANYLDGIVSKDDLKFIDGEYSISAVDDGIRGKDSVYIVGGDFDIAAGGDGIKSTNDIEATKGFIRIESGDFMINSAQKGIKATNDISIDAGTFIITSGDDAIHSNDYIGIRGGSYDVVSYDDGIHADAEVVIDNGEIDITKSYEGIEAARVTINDGNISLITRDDGINIAGGNDNSSQNRPGANPFAVNEENILTFNGGKLYINSTGDGLDSNGYVYVNGGSVVIDGPISNADGALDANGGVIVNDGTLIAVGASGMAESISEKSAINGISAYISSSTVGETISLVDDSGNVVISHAAAKSFSHIAIASPSLKSGKNYTLKVGNNSQNITLKGVVTTIGTRGGTDFQNHGRK